jgi:rare lipoprotein A (peptidoglycan hydrolase)
VKPLTKHPTRIVDMSYAAAKALNIQTRGVARVKVQQIK